MDEEREGELRLGPFKSWTSLYVTVLLYTAALVAVLGWFSAAFDFSAGGS